MSYSYRLPSHRLSIRHLRKQRPRLPPMTRRRSGLRQRMTSNRKIRRSMISSPMISRQVISSLSLILPAVMKPIPAVMIAAMTTIMIRAGLTRAVTSTRSLMASSVMHQDRQLIPTIQSSPIIRLTTNMLTRRIIISASMIPGPLCVRRKKM